MATLATLLVTACLATSIQSQAADLSTHPRIFESTTLPADRFMASVGNGHVATVLTSNTIFMNGLYSGKGGDSHRARIPARINIRIPAPTESARFVLNTEEGTFAERNSINDVVIEQLTYAHRLHTPLLVVQIRADFSQSEAQNITVTVEDNSSILPSTDIVFRPPESFSEGLGWYQNGTTLFVENSDYQSDGIPIHVVYSEVPETLTLTREQPMKTFLMSMAKSYEEASDAYLNGINSAPQEVLQTHISAWAAIWDAGNIYLEGPNLELAKVVSGSLYYLLSSLPWQENNVERKRFYGLSPGSLANGALGRDYQGHSFWDSETWMYPSILLLWPHIAKDFLLYRMANVVPARDRANATGYRGIRFPWESAFTGAEVTPDFAADTRDNQQHITGDISFASRQYVAVTGDRGWLVGEDYSFPLEVTQITSLLTEYHFHAEDYGQVSISCPKDQVLKGLNGCDFVRGMAEFWASRAEFNAETGQYEINGVMPPDEYHPRVNNSAYTNVGAAFSIFFAKHVECLCQGSMSSPIPEEWLETARRLTLPTDELHPDYQPEYQDYVRGETIKQADVVLLGYPVMFTKDAVQRKNDLEAYEEVTDPNGPAMTWGMHSIGHLDLNEDEQAEVLFNRSYQPYKIEPFKVWSESPNESGALNFITGMGGFLQALIFGYGGVRIHLDHLEVNPKLPRGVTKFTIHGMNYLECSIDIQINSTAVRVDWNGDSCQRLILIADGQVNQATTLQSNSPRTIELARKPFSIFPEEVPKCPLPEDNLGMGPSGGATPVAFRLAFFYLFVGFAVFLFGN